MVFGVLIMIVRQKRWRNNSFAKLMELQVINIIFPKNCSLSITICWCLFVCLFVQGWLFVLHACPTNWIRICSVPQGLDATPHPGTEHESNEGFWTGLFFLVVFDPMPMEAKCLGLRTNPWIIICYKYSFQMYLLLKILTMS